MKYLIVLFFAIASCSNKELSKSDKEDIQWKIDFHNNKNRFDFKRDSINEVTNMEIKYISKPKPLVKESIEAHMPVFSNEWNKPYKIEKDRFLTFDSYLQYCKSYNYDPKEYASTLGK